MIAPHEVGFESAGDYDRYEAYIDSQLMRVWRRGEERIVTLSLPYQTSGPHPIIIELGRRYWDAGWENYNYGTSSLLFKAPKTGQPDSVIG